MKKAKFGNLNFDSVETLSRAELKKVTGGYDNSWYNESYPTPPSQTVQCDCLVRLYNGVLPYNQLVQWTSYTGSCYPRPTGVTC